MHGRPTPTPPSRVRLPAVFAAGAVVTCAVVAWIFIAGGRPPAQPQPPGRGAPDPAADDGARAQRPGTWSAGATQERGVSPAPAPPPARAEAPPAVARAEADLGRMLEAQRSVFVEKCVAQGRDPAWGPVRLTFRVVVDADGKEVERQVLEQREPPQPDTAQCIVQYLPRLDLSSPGATVELSAEMTLP